LRPVWRNLIKEIAAKFGGAHRRWGAARQTFTGVGPDHSRSHFQNSRRHPSSPDCN
jgi:hypothetical protein